MSELELTDADGDPLLGPSTAGSGSGHTDLIPGDPIHIRGDFTAGRYLAFLLDYHGLHHSLLALRFVLRGEQVPRVYVHAAMIPDQEAPLIIDLQQLDGQRDLLTRTPGMLRASCHGERIEPAAIGHIELELVRTGLEQHCAMSHPRLYTSHPPVRVPGRRLLDPFGQLAIRDWPGRCRDEAHLLATLQGEARAPDPGYHAPPPPTREASECYRTERIDGRWWLVDPRGRARFSSGLIGVTDGPSAAIVPGTEGWYSWIPERSGEFADCRKEDDARGLPLALYPRANLRRAFGDGWRSTWQRITANRLQQWHFHALGHGSDRQLAERHALSFVHHLRGFPSTETRLWRGLPDVFAAEFARAAHDFAAPLAELADHRAMVGYLLADQPGWAVPADALAAALLAQEGRNATRRAMARRIAERHGHDAERWCAAWSLSAGTSFAELEGASFAGRLGRSAAVHGDLVAAGQLVLEQALRSVLQACRAAAPRHLNLGMLASSGAFDLLAAIATEADVLCLGGHRILPDQAAIEHLAEAHGLPLWIMGFEVGAIDRGLLGTGARAVPSTPDRALAYQRHLEHCAALGDVVGCHIASYIDHPALGDPDGRCGNVGLVDVCHRPYEEVVAAVALANQRLDDLHRGLGEPLDERVREITAISV